MKTILKSIKSELKFILLVVVLVSFVYWASGKMNLNSKVVLCSGTLGLVVIIAMVINTCMLRIRLEKSGTKCPQCGQKSWQTAGPPEEGTCPLHCSDCGYDWNAVIR